MSIHTTYKFRHFRPGDGGRDLLWASGLGEIEPVREGSPAFNAFVADQPWSDNALVDEGEQSILATYFQGAAGPAGFFFRLYNDTPVDTDTLADLLNEVAGTGYAPIAVARSTGDFPTLALDAGDYMVTSATKQFAATGAWTDATVLALATSSDNSGLLIAWVALSATRTLQAGDTLDVSMAVKLG